jgi:hypothetical protein
MRFLKYIEIRSKPKGGAGRRSKWERKTHIAHSTLLKAKNDIYFILSKGLK